MTKLIQTILGFISIIIFCGVECDIINTAPIETPWSETVNGLQFRIKVIKTIIKEDEEIPIQIYVKNVSAKKIAVLDPAKLPEEVKNIVFHPFLFKKIEGEDYVEGSKLDTTFKLGWYSIVEPGEMLSGTTNIPQSAPIGTYNLFMGVYMIEANNYMAGFEKWKRQDKDRICPIAWTNQEKTKNAGKRTPELGPINIEIQ